MEADPRHAELIIEQLGLNDANGVVTPGVKEDEEVEEGEEEPDHLQGNDVTMFRRVAARCNYLALPDIQYAVKEICREMSQPTTKSLMRLKRIGRYLKKDTDTC